MNASTTYDRAKEMQQLVAGFSTVAKIIYDPSVVPDGGWQGSGQLDEASGVTVYEVPKDTPGDTEAAYMLFLKVPQPMLAVSPSLYNAAGRKTKAGEKVTDGYTLSPSVEGTVTENVADLDAVAKDHKAKAAAGHPLYNNGIKFGDNLVAMGQLIMEDLTVNTNTVVALYWSSKPFNERQEQG